MDPSIVALIIVMTAMCLIDCFYSFGWWARAKAEMNRKHRKLDEESE